MKWRLAFVALVAAVIVRMPSDAYAQGCYQRQGNACVGPGYKMGFYPPDCKFRCFPLTNSVHKPKAKTHAIGKSDRYLSY